jgi:hypothetical protein
MQASFTWLDALPLVGWPGIDRRTLAALLPEPLVAGEIRRLHALVLDRRFVRSLRALGHTVILPETPGAFPAENGPFQLVCAPVLPESGGEAGAADVIGALRQYAGWLPGGGTIILRSAARERERVSAAFLHAGLFDVRQARSGRGFLTAGVLHEIPPGTID